MEYVERSVSKDRIGGSGRVVLDKMLDEYGLDIQKGYEEGDILLEGERGIVDTAENLLTSYFPRARYRLIEEPTFRLETMWKEIGRELGEPL